MMRAKRALTGAIDNTPTPRISDLSDKSKSKQQQIQKKKPSVDKGREF